MLRRKEKNEKDVQYILDNLREFDKLECETLHGENWKETEYNEIMNSSSHILLGVDKNDVPVCIGGVCDTSEQGVGVVWLLSTNDVTKHKFSFLKEMKKEFEKYDEKYWFLYNFIYCKNHIAKNWLKWIGFKFDIPKPVGYKIPEGFEFFYRMREHRGLI